jgi:hypothetical protein
MGLIRNAAGAVGIFLVKWSGLFRFVAPGDDTEAVRITLDRPDEFAIIKANTYTRRILPKVGNPDKN